MTAPQPVTIDRLIEYLWVGPVPSSARTMVHVHVAALRRSLGKVIVTDGSAYRLADDVSLTVDEFRLEAAQAIRDQHRRPAEALASAASALGRHRARPLPELADHPDGLTAATTLDDLRRRVLEVWAGLMVEAGRSAETIEPLDLAIAGDPLHEPYRELLMRARYEIGDHVGAVRSFTSYRRLLANEVGLEPGPSIVELERRVLLHDRPDRRLNAEDGMLPDLAAPLVGRELELATVEHALSDRRLVTILGPPGVGKTRLAHEVAARRRSHGDSVHLLSLVGVAKAAHAAEAIDRAIAAVRGADPSHDAVLVIDNAEQHVALLRERLPPLLSSNDRMRAVVTSRTKIGCRGERRVALGAFDVPHHGAELEALVGNPAVQLFVDSVRAVAPGFRLTADNVDHVVAAVMRTDGLPLSIELAAAWVPAVGVAGLGQVESGPRTLTETITDNLLTLEPSELAVLQAAASTARWFDVEMLHALMPAAPATPGARTSDPITAAVRSLIDRSLIESDHRADGRVRHRLLEPVKEAVLGQTSDDHRMAIRHAHLELIRQHARQTMQRTGTADEPRQFAEVDDLFADYRIAMSNAIEDGEPSAAVEIASSIWRYWFTRFRLAEGFAVLRRAHDALGPNGIEPLGARTLGWLLYMAGQPRDADAMLERAVERALRHRQHDVVIRCRLDQAQLATGRGQPDESLRRLADARSRLSRHTWPWADAVLHCRTGAAFAELGQVPTATHHLDVAVNELEAIGDRRELGLALALRSHMRRLAGNPPAALADALAALRAARVLHDEPLGCTAGIALAPAAAAAGDVEVATSAVAEVATVLPHDSAVDVCQLVLAGAAVASAVGEAQRAERWVRWCHDTYAAAGGRLPRLQSDIAALAGEDEPRRDPAPPSTVAAEVADFVGSVVPAREPSMPAIRHRPGV